MTGRLPVRVEPVAGEAIDSWLAATARAMNVTVGSIARVFGLPTVLHPLWINWLAPDQVNAVTAATGLAASTVEAMTLSTYDGVALKLDPDTHRLTADFPFNAVAFSRFCPDCLSESDGRWQLTWRLGWKFACTRHNSLLSDECPKCGKHQHKDQVFKEPPMPASCRCGFDLRTTSMEKLSIAHPILQAQQRVHELIFGGFTSFGVFEEMRIALVDVLTTIRSLANRVLAFAAVEGLASVTAAEVPRWVDRVERTTRPLLVRNAVNNRVPWRAVDTAVGVTAALSILNTATIRDAGVCARPYLWGQNADTGAAELRSCARDGVIPAAIAIKASIPWMGPELELRYRAATAVPQPPRGNVNRARDIAAGLPTMMWPEWSERLSAGMRRTIAGRETLSWATLLVGSTIDTVAAARLLKQHARRNALNQRLWVFRSSASWESICTGLIVLSDYLATNESPIDYARRRQLDFSDLLSDGAWEQICLDAGAGMQQGSVQNGRAYMIEVLTGCPTSRERGQRIRAGRKAEFRDPPRNVLDALDEHALVFLRRHNVDEPLSWHPPLALLDELDLPGT